MRAVLQRVTKAQVSVEGLVKGKIANGLLVYLGIGIDDTNQDAEFIAKKIAELRIFPDEAGKMNRSISQAAGKVLLISNFTLYGNCSKGRRPGFDKSAEPAAAKKLYELTADLIISKGIEVEKGIFAAHMHVESTNNGPVTFILES